MSSQSCKVCGAEVVAKGLCSRCYMRERRGRPPLTEPGKAAKGEGMVPVRFQLNAGVRELVRALVEERTQDDPTFDLSAWLREAVAEKANREMARLL